MIESWPSSEFIFKSSESQTQTSDTDKSNKEIKMRMKGRQSNAINIICYEKPLLNPESAAKLGQAFWRNQPE